MTRRSAGAGGTVGPPRLNEVARVARDAVLLSLGAIGGAALSFLVWVYLARALPPADYGALGAAVAFVALFQLFGDLGINYYAIREGAKDPSSATAVLRTLLGLKLAMLVGATALVAALALLLPFRATERGLVLAFLATLPISGIANYLACLLNVHRRMPRLAAIQVGERLAYAALVPPAVFLGLGVYGAVLAAVSSATLYLGLAIAAVRPLRSGPLWPPSAAATWRPHLAVAFQFGVAALLVSVMQRVDVVLLAVLSDPTNLARYVAAAQVFFLLLLISTAVAQAAFPWLVHRLHRGAMSLSTLAKWSAVLAVVSVAVGFAGFASAPLVFPFLFGADLGEGSAVFRILVWAFVPALATIPASLALDALNLQKVHIANATVMAGINVALNLMWIPSMGATGAAWAAVASWGFGLFGGVPIAFAILRRHQGRLRTAPP